jgi:hypothetical protein
MKLRGERRKNWREISNKDKINFVTSTRTGKCYNIKKGIEKEVTSTWEAPAPDKWRHTEEKDIPGE